MDRFITSYGDYSIWQLAKSGLYNLARFVVIENYKHHQMLSDSAMISDSEVQIVYNEEVQYFEQSRIFVVKNHINEIVGAIRIMNWNKRDELPITRLFGIDRINNTSFKDDGIDIWHVGRFAVSSGLGRDALSLFRVLMMFAVAPICKSDNGVMIAECDSKLFKTVQKLGMNVIALNEGIEYLGSVTIPIYATRNGLLEFVARNCALAVNVEGTINGREQIMISHSERKCA